MRSASVTEAEVIVVGGGPAGCMAAYELARAGIRVLVLEEHPEVGAPCHCAGLVSPRTIELAGLPTEGTSLADFRRARVWGPLGSVTWLESETIQAVAIDRVALDRHMAERAARAGAVLWSDHRAMSFERRPGRVVVHAANHNGLRRLHARLLIGADGAHSRVAQWLDGVEPWDAVPAVGAEIYFRGRGSPDIEVFTGSSLAPGWFGWVIPLGGGRARVGLGGRCRDLRQRFAAFMHLLADRFGPIGLESQRGWSIAATPRQRIAFDQAMLVGDAACQAKPSSGGGIYMGMRAGALAARVAHEALDTGDLSYRSLSLYEREWAQEEGEELRYNLWLRRIYNAMSDREIDRLVSLCNRPWARALVGQLGDIDFASQLFKPVHLALQAAAPKLVRALGDRLRSLPGQPLNEALDGLELDPETVLRTLEQ